MSTSPVEVVSSTSKSVMTKANEAKSKLLGYCKSENILSCVVVLLVIAYVALLDQSNAIDFFNTAMGRGISMVVVLLAASIDMRLGLLVSVALVLSIVYAAMNDEIESFEEEMTGEEVQLAGLEDSVGLEDVMESSEDEEIMESYDTYASATGVDDTTPLVSSEDNEETSEDFEDFAPANF